MEHLRNALPIFFVCAAAAAAQTSPEAAGVASGGARTVADLFRSCGWIGWVLAAMSVFAFADMCYLFATLRRGAVAPRAVVNDVMDNVSAGALDAARKVCDYRPGPFSFIAMAAIDAVRELPSPDVASVTSVAEGEGARQAAKLQSRAQWLLDVAALAPMVGMLGTVLGMFEAFRAVGGEYAVAAKPVVLAQGVSFALVTTVGGLFVAIPCMALYAWFRRQAARQTATLEALATDLVIALLSARRGAPAAAAGRESVR